MCSKVYIFVAIFLAYASNPAWAGTFYEKVSNGNNDEDDSGVSTKGFHECSLENNCNFVAVSRTDNQVYRVANRDELEKIDKKLNIWKKVKTIDFSENIYNNKQVFDSCKEAMEDGQRGNGTIELMWVNGSRLHVFCDMVTDGGGWTVFQRRLNNSFNFERNWEAYENGFGDLKSSFWLGLKALHFLTSKGSSTLRVDLQDCDGDRGYAKYTNFKIGSKEQKYKVTFDKYSGNIGDAMQRSKGMAFSTYDQDNDIWDDNCASRFKGGWWHAVCFDCNLNNWFPGSRSTNSSPPKADSMSWRLWKQNQYGNIIFSEMKIKREN